MTADWWIILALFLTAMLAELLNLQRAFASRRLVFPAVRHRLISPIAFVAGIGVVRAIALTGMAWSLFTLARVEPRKMTANQLPAGEALRRVVIMLDVSPSMDLADVGPDSVPRKWRASVAISDLLSKLDLSKVRLSLLPFYTSIKPIVLDTTDANIINTMSRGLPLYSIFKPGPTQLSNAVGEAFKIMEKWEPSSTTLVVLTDGDSSEAPLTVARPASIRKVIVCGLGNPQKGTFIDDHLSRQDVMALTRMAQRIGGVYVNINEMPIPTDLTESISGTFSVNEPPTVFGRREVALLALAGSALLFLFLPLVIVAFNRASAEPHLELAKKEGQ